MLSEYLNSNLCLDHFFSECKKENCAFKHLNEEELAGEIVLHQKAIEKNCLISNDTIKLSLIELSFYGIYDFNLVLICLKQFMKAWGFSSIKNLDVFFPTFIPENTFLTIKIIKKMRKFLKLENLTLGFYGAKPDCIEKILNEIIILNENSKKLLKITLCFLKCDLKYDHLKSFCDFISSPKIKLQSFQFSFEECNFDDIEFFFTMFQSNIRCLVLYINKVKVENFKKMFCKHLFESFPKEEIKKLKITEKYSDFIDNQIYINFENSQMSISFSGFPSLSSERISKEIYENINVIGKFNNLVELSLLLNPKYQLNYNYFADFMKDIPIKFNDLLKFELNIIDFKSSRTEKMVAMVKKWIFSKKHLINCLLLAQKTKQIKKSHLTLIFHEYFLK